MSAHEHPVEISLTTDMMNKAANYPDPMGTITALQKECERLKAELAQAKAVIRGMVAAMHQYQMNVDCPAPRDHVAIMNRAEALLLPSKETSDTKQP